jgi:hypothetical protein
VASAQVAGAAAAPVAAAAAPVAPEPIGLSEALDSLAPPDETPSAEPAAEPAPVAPDPAAPAAAAVDPLSAEALAAPGGIEKAQAFLREKQQAHDRAYLKLAKREHSLKNSVERWKVELGQSRAFVQAVQADIGLLQQGTAEQKLEALGRLSRKDGLKAWEEIAISAASGGRKAPAPEVAELRDEIRQLRQEREAERAQAHEHGQRQQLHEQKVRLVQGATDAATYPALAQFAAQKPAEVADYLTTMIVEAHEAGRPITWQQAYARVNQELAPYHQTAAQPAAAAPAAGGSGPSGTHPPKPVQPTPRSPGRSLNPGLATAQGQVREMTEAERVQELASDPTFLQSLFG